MEHDQDRELCGPIATLRRSLFSFMAGIVRHTVIIITVVFLNNNDDDFV